MATLTSAPFSISSFAAYIFAVQRGNAQGGNPAFLVNDFYIRPFSREHLDRLKVAVSRPPTHQGGTVVLVRSINFASLVEKQLDNFRLTPSPPRT